ncbi:MAG: radical SAM protein, partial [Phycisphaerales bacterium]|nr:radical SAM protein [Phycisphaerales bacterium]
MARLQEREETYFTTVRGMCRQCREVTPVRVFFRDGQVWQQSLCPTCENQPALIAADKDWYLANVLRAIPDRSPLPNSKPCKQGCPHDCGPCAWHASPCQLPVISITNACNLRCPICFTYNRADRIYHMPVDELRQTVDWIVQSTGGVDLINLTGGEPTL